MISFLCLARRPSQVLLALALLGSPGLATAESMDLAAVITQVLSSHPDLDISRIDTEIASTDRQNTEGILDPVLSASIGVSEDKTPVSSIFQSSKSRQGQVSAGISQPLASGATLSASAAFNRNKKSYASPAAAAFSLINPEYRNQFDISYRHPLLRGADRPDYRNTLVAADAGVQSARQQQQVVARALSLQALNLFYQLASDEINVRIAEDAVKRAKQLLSYQHSREQFGLIEASDRLQAEALLAARQTALEQARGRHASDMAQLNRLMLRQPMHLITLKTAPDMPDEAPDLEEAVSISKQKRPEFAALQARLEASEAMLKTARDQDQIQLDMVAQLGTRSLDGSAGAALQKSTSIHDHFASLSLEMSDVIHRNAAHAGIRKAELNRLRIVSEQRQVLESVRNDLSNAITAIRTGLPALKAAQKQVSIEKKKFAAESRRYREGRSDTATIVQFEGDLSNAELQAELLKLNLQLADKQLIWAQGLLLSRLGIPIATRNNPS